MRGVEYVIEQKHLYKTDLGILVNRMLNPNSAAH